MESFTLTIERNTDLDPGILGQLIQRRSVSGTEVGGGEDSYLETSLSLSVGSSHPLEDVSQLSNPSILDETDQEIEALCRLLFGPQLGVQ